jgi:acetylornithine/succinyldiaminopimelate/putrescine aminotransferase
MAIHIPVLLKAQQRQCCIQGLLQSALEGFLEELCHITGLDRALPISRGAETVETAIKAARRWGDRIKRIEPERAEMVSRREFSQQHVNHFLKNDIRAP